MNGILIVDKPEGLTSHDVIDFIRKKFQIKNVGHTGTLDPQATGVLVVLIGKFTKISKYLVSHDKKYRACLTLGIETDTQDKEGRIVRREKIKDIEPKQIEKIFSQFTGEIEQKPPMFSALKIGGKKLYELARRGKEIERNMRKVFIYKLKITKVRLPHICFEVECSKGTYIRTLCVDIAKKLGYPGHMSNLRRIRSGPFTLSHSISFNDLKLFL